MPETTYKYDPVDNKIIATSKNSGDDKAEFDHVAQMNINPHIFLGKTGRYIMNQLRVTHPELANEFKQVLAKATEGFPNLKSEDPEKYGFIRAIQLATFINTKWYLSDANPQKLSNGFFPRPDSDFAC